MSKLRCSSEGVSSISQLLLNPLWEEHQTQLSLGSRSGFKSSELSDAEIGSAKKEASSMSKHSGSVLLACLCLCSGTAEDSDNFLVILDFSWWFLGLLDLNPLSDCTPMRESI
jgi:hypothetical protein